MKAVLGDFCEDWHLLLPIMVGQRYAGFQVQIGISRFQSGGGNGGEGLESECQVTCPVTGEQVERLPARIGCLSTDEAEFWMASVLSYQGQIMERGFALSGRFLSSQALARFGVLLGSGSYYSGPGGWWVWVIPRAGDWC